MSIVQRVQYDIWVQVVSWLPRSQLKPLLQASRSLHDAALPILFSSVKIYLMSDDGTSHVIEITEPEFPILQGQRLMQRSMRRSWELLRRVIEDTWFSKSVKELIMVNCEYTLSFPEKYMIEKAMEALRNLRTFRCHQPSRTEAPWTEDILKFLPQTVEHLTCPLLKSVDVLKRLPSLKILECQRESSFNLGPHLPQKLHRLSIPKYDAGHIPFHTFHNLRVLEISNSSFAVPLSDFDLELACRHCTRLEELSLIGAFKPDILAQLPRDASAVPELHSLRIVFDARPPDDGWDDDHIAAVESFLDNHQGLRRLCLDIAGFPWTMIMWSIDALHSLEVFGLHIFRFTLTDNLIMSLVNRIPKSVKALHLRFVWNPSETLHTFVFMNALAQFPHLSSLSIGNDSFSFPFTVKHFAGKIPKLRMVGFELALGETMWDIRRVGSTKKAAKWAPWKLAFPMDSDFEDEDDAWLHQCPPRMRR